MGLSSCVIHTPPSSCCCGMRFSFAAFGGCSYRGHTKRRRDCRDQIPACSQRSLVLWMVHPTRHEDTIYGGVYTCPDQTMGHYLDGPTRVSLVDTTLGKVINT